MPVKFILMNLDKMSEVGSIYLPYQVWYRNQKSRNDKAYRKTISYGVVRNPEYSLAVTDVQRQS